jgi:hypothetical protein
MLAERVPHEPHVRGIVLSEHDLTGRTRCRHIEPFRVAGVGGVSAIILSHLKGCLRNLTAHGLQVIRSVYTNLYGYFYMAQAAVKHNTQCSSYITGEILPIVGGYSGG